MPNPSDAIDIEKPISGSPTTQSVRDNFSATKSAIVQLESGKQNTLVTLTAGTAANTLPAAGVATALTALFNTTRNCLSWLVQRANAIPAGGSIGQVLTKRTPTDFDAVWQTATAGVATADIPVLAVQFVRASNALTRLRMVSGSLQSGDQIFLLRHSRSGHGRKYKPGHVYKGCTMTRMSQWDARKGFRHPRDWPKWGQVAAVEWTPAFRHPDGGQVRPGAIMDIRFNTYMEMMRNKTQHRRRGRELIKFVVARPLPGIHAAQARTYQFGACANTVVVRLHKHQGVGVYGRTTSVSLRS